MLAKRTLEHALITFAIVTLTLNAILKFAARTVMDRGQAIGNENGAFGFFDAYSLYADSAGCERRDMERRTQRGRAPI